MDEKKLEKLKIVYNKALNEWIEAKNTCTNGSIEASARAKRAWLAYSHAKDAFFKARGEGLDGRQ